MDFRANYFYETIAFLHIDQWSHQGSVKWCSFSLAAIVMRANLDRHYASELVRTS